MNIKMNMRGGGRWELGTDGGAGGSQTGGWCQMETGARWGTGEQTGAGPDADGDRGV